MKRVREQTKTYTQTYASHIQTHESDAHMLTHRHMGMPLSLLFFSSFNLSSHLLPCSSPPSCVQSDSSGEDESGGERERERMEALNK